MKWISLLSVLFFIFHLPVYAQYSFVEKDYSLLENRIYYSMLESEPDGAYSESENNEYPSPRSVMFKSLMIPGWGQIENGQIWKVPIVYGLFAGVAVYTVYLNDMYQDYRAAFYNTTQGADTDFKFGPTPERLEGINSNQLQSARNSFRNQRDFMFVVMGLAYGLNVLDAYVFAHMRSFDVSDDLSARVGPAIIDEKTPGVRVSLNF